MNYFLKLLCLFRKLKRCQVGKIYQFLTINQSKIQITDNFKSLSTKFYGATCQEVLIKTFETSKVCPLNNKMGTWGTLNKTNNYHSKISTMPNLKLHYQRSNLECKGPPRRIIQIWEKKQQTSPSCVFRSRDSRYTANVLSAKSTDECLRTKSQDN